MLEAKYALSSRLTHCCWCQLERLHLSAHTISGPGRERRGEGFPGRPDLIAFFALCITQLVASNLVTLATLPYNDKYRSISPLSSTISSPTHNVYRTSFSSELFAVHLLIGLPKQRNTKVRARAKYTGNARRLSATTLPERA